VWDAPELRASTLIKKHTYFLQVNHFVGRAATVGWRWPMRRRFRFATHFLEKTPRTARGHRGNVVSVAFPPDGKRLASASHDKPSDCWDPETGTEVLTLADHPGAVSGRRVRANATVCSAPAGMKRW